MLPQDANPAGNIFGGVILKYIDLAAATAAMRHARQAVVTASIDRMDFLLPAHVGELVLFQACVNHVGRSSMEVGVRVEAEDLLTGERRHTGSAYVTFVVIDESRKPAPAPALLLETDEERRRFKEAEERRKMRLAERNRERASQDSQRKNAEQKDKE
jgi:acyl-CoA hydrolase